MGSGKERKERQRRSDTPGVVSGGDERITDLCSNSSSTREWSKNESDAPGCAAIVGIFSLCPFLDDAVRGSSCRTWLSGTS